MVLDDELKEPAQSLFIPDSLHIRTENGPVPRFKSAADSSEVQLQPTMQPVFKGSDKLVQGSQGKRSKGSIPSLDDGKRYAPFSLVELPVAKRFAV